MPLTGPQLLLCLYGRTTYVRTRTCNTCLYNCKFHRHFLLLSLSAIKIRSQSRSRSLISMTCSFLQTKKRIGKCIRLRKMRGLWESPHATQTEVEHWVLIPTLYIYTAFNYQYEQVLKRANTPFPMMSSSDGLVASHLITYLMSPSAVRCGALWEHFKARLKLVLISENVF